MRCFAVMALLVQKGRPWSAVTVAQTHPRALIVEAGLTMARAPTAGARAQALTVQTRARAQGLTVQAPTVRARTLTTRALSPTVRTPTIPARAHPTAQARTQTLHPRMMIRTRMTRHTIRAMIRTRTGTLAAT